MHKQTREGTQQCGIILVNVCVL